ncbi:MULTISPECIES: UbiA family prenyltransferase [unclassified Mucilaginibacter]|uniref:UbiA family prenyltransferase n=1 Tax=unclassified Mucilaginibacter TaxID=2617802 RepID=UPI002AC919C5|nr:MULTISPECIES: UbiA family prenyltransferase [unclassified Mucilaginibacter]MEB0262607.1 UbiA family prenyltransferase [Mucilaginibacter sp. 10I4]MEB0279226.1 UbiA family prenyltransferase [Mucilaginibacter sp. 10B2]MEB0300674.1 UbiA family prenyltransferase [Mucilaginibacter sp. 5C4]WPX23261.1 UbiA family prenyltransferase [Mucilaginibacter sp. 5C4]
MKKAFQSAFDFLLFSNIFMSLCAVAQALVTFHLIDSKPVYAILALLFTSTLGIYNFSILLSKPKHPERSPYKRVRWFFAHYRLMITFTIISLLSLIPLFFLLSMESRILLVFSAILAFSYSLPLFTVGEQKFGLRNIPGLKTFLISLVWTLSSVLLPVLEAKDLHMADITTRDITIMMAKRFLLIFALAIPFDIRDLFSDRQAGLKTIPVAWGEKNAYLFCQFLLAGYIVLLFLFRNNGFNVDFFALTTTAVLMGWLIFKSKREKNEYYYFFYMDGVLILQYVILIGFSLMYGHYAG